MQKICCYYTDITFRFYTLHNPSGSTLVRSKMICTAWLSCEKFYYPDCLSPAKCGSGALFRVIFLNFMILYRKMRLKNNQQFFLIQDCCFILYHQKFQKSIRKGFAPKKRFAWQDFWQEYDLLRRSFCKFVRQEKICLKRKVLLKMLPWHHPL